MLSSSIGVGSYAGVPAGGRNSLLPFLSYFGCCCWPSSLGAESLLALSAWASLRILPTSILSRIPPRPCAPSFLAAESSTFLTASSTRPSRLVEDEEDPDAASLQDVVVDLDGSEDDGDDDDADDPNNEPDGDDNDESDGDDNEEPDGDNDAEDDSDDDAERGWDQFYLSPTELAAKWATAAKQ